VRQFRFDPLIGSIITIGIFGLFLIMRGRNPTLPFAKRIGSMTYALYLLHFHIGLTIFSRWIDESNKWLMVAGVSLFMIAASFAIDHVLEFRLRPFWLKLAARTVARPFARWGQRNVPAHGDGIDMPQLKPFP